MWRLVWLLFACIASVSQAAEDPSDTYLYWSDCPAVGPSLPQDAFNFYKCQCTSYVSHKLNERWGNTNPRFTNQYYSHDRWGHAYEWLDRAIDSEIGITGARDNFTWDENAYNAVFVGDVALWNAYGSGAFSHGHVAYVEAVGQDAAGRGVSWVTISEYNFVNPGYEYSRRTLYKSNHPNPRFPDYFLHIDQDRSYCLRPENRETGSCRTLNAGTRVANGSRQKYIGGLGGSSTPFNLAVNRFWVTNAAGTQLVADTSTVKPGQGIAVKVQVKAKDGNTSAYMRAGKKSIEVDLYVRENLGDWRFLQRTYIQATSLPSGATHTETVQYIVPSGVSTVSFKAKIDAEDEASESNEGDNWSRIETFRIDVSPWLIPIL